MYDLELCLRRYRRHMYVSFRTLPQTLPAPYVCIIQDFASDATGAIFNTMVIEKAEKGSKSGSEVKEHFLLSSGWNGAVWLYRLDGGEDVTPHLQKLVPKNSKTPLDEIISMAFHAPSTLITGRRDGRLLVWNTITYALLADHYLDEGARIKDNSLIEPQISRQKRVATGINSQTAAPASWSPQYPAAVGSGKRGGENCILRVATAAAAPVSKETRPRAQLAQQGGGGGARPSGARHSS
jgi:hypothetical protein